MRILVGKIINWGAEPVTAIEIPSLGVFKVEQEQDDFDYIDLHKEQLIELKELIEKELSDAKD